MSKPGITPEEFIERVAASRHIADDWPFGNLARVDTLEQTPPFSNDEPAGIIQTVVSLCETYHGGVSLQTPGKPHELAYLEVPTEDTIETRLAWQAMKGVRLRIEAEVLEQHPARSDRDALLRRILSVEPPLRSPASRNGWATQYGRRHEGYIHGTVHSISDHASERPYDYAVQIRLGAELRDSLLLCRNALTRSARGEREPVAPYIVPGKTIRARVSRLSVHEPELGYITQQPLSVIQVLS